MIDSKYKTVFKYYHSMYVLMGSSFLFWRFSSDTAGIDEVATFISYFKQILAGFKIALTLYISTLITFHIT